MEMFFLIIKLGYGSVVMPDKYPKDQCELAGQNSTNSYLCIKAPYDNFYNCATSVPDPLNPGRYQIAKTHCDLPTGK